MNYKNNRESGQAIAEMCISLIAIMVIFLGVIFIAGLGISNVQLLISAKETAEESARDDKEGGRGNYIKYWNYGNDELPFTADDYAINVGNHDTGTVLNSSLDDETYSTGLNYYNDYFYNKGHNIPYKFMPVSGTSVYHESIFASMDLARFFVSAADLVESSIHYDIDGDKNIYDVEQLKLNLGNLIHVNLDAIDLEKMNKVYMPKLPSNLP